MNDVWFATDTALFTTSNNQLRANSVFDFETKNSYSIRVRTTDQNGLSFEKQLTIGVTNVDNIITGNANNENFTTTTEKDIIDAQFSFGKKPLSQLMIQQQGLMLPPMPSLKLQD
ncbi:MAG: hypothetical protein RLZZ176_1961 [Cyanobacteriota bacterium]|jgi:hypothetical protein